MGHRPPRSLIIVAALLFSAASLLQEMPRARTTSPRYTFTRIAEHGFFQTVSGSGADPVPQRIDPFSPSINDDGRVAFGHTVDIFGLNRTVVSAGNGGGVQQIYGGGFLTPFTSRTGLDGEGAVYLVENVTANNGEPAGWPCGVGVTGPCLFNTTRTVGIRMTPGRESLFLVNGAHPSLRSPSFPDRIVYQVDVPHLQVRTESGLIAEVGPLFSGIAFGTFDINVTGEMVFLAQTTLSGIFAARAGQQPRLVLQNNAPGGISFSSIASPRIDDGGRVFFSATLPGQQGFNIYRIDPGSPEPVLLVDGNTGLFRIMTPVAVNGVGSMVFLAERGVGGPRGIYTGPEPANDKVIAVDDELDGEKVIALELNSRAINNNGPSRRGQIVFAAQLSSDSGYSIYRADPVNQPPAAQDGSIRVRAGTSVSGTLVAADADGSALTCSIVANPVKGTVVVNDASSGSFTYTANVGANGTDTFTFKANDGFSDSNVATMTVTIDSPECAADITALVGISLGMERWDKPSGHYFQKVTVTNTSSDAISGPIWFVLDSLTSDATLVDAAGLTSCAAPAGSPYVMLKLEPDGVLARRERITTQLEFAIGPGTPRKHPVSYMPRVLAGTGAR